MSASSVQLLREQVRSEGLLDDAQRLVAMLSGGRDSVCLLDVVVALQGALCVTALHVNYGLRAQAVEEERHCARLCAALGVELEVVRAAPQTRAPGNLQAWARELRYAAAARLAGRLDGMEPDAAGAGSPRTLIATGHTASDQVETILYRLAASPGRRALLGMVASEGSIVRPLLGVTRAQTTAYCRARGLAWRDDESNDDDRYARARVRQGLVPALRTVHPAAEANVLRTASLLREEGELLDRLVADELQGRASIALARLAELPPALARLVVVRLAEQAVGGYVPQAGARVQEILALASRTGGAQLHIGNHAAAVIEDGQLRMVRLPPRAA